MEIQKQQVRKERLLDSAARPFQAGTLRHTLHTLASKIPGFFNILKPDPKSRLHQAVSSKVRDSKKAVSVAAETAVKVKTAMTPRVVDAMKLLSKFKNRIPISKFGAVTGGALILGIFATKFLSGLWNSNQGSNYIPDKYSRGYDTIKESMTDFGSRVFLSKTASKVNVTPRNTTRNALIRTTNSVCDSNLAFRLHKNAINHTRY